MQTQGGGNAGNALTSAARLGLVRPALITKIGSDSVGDQILAELKGDGVDVSHVLRAPDAPSPFTYIIVDREGDQFNPVSACAVAFNGCLPLLGSADISKCLCGTRCLQVPQPH